MAIGADEIRHWHVEQNGWDDIGYHYVIRRNGSVERGRDESIVGAHEKNNNRDSIGICLVGGKRKDGKSDSNFTADQYIALRALLADLLYRYKGAELHGHRDFSPKDCPCFDIRAFYYG